MKEETKILRWCYLYTLLGVTSGWAVLDALFRFEPPSMLDSIANSSIMKAEIASPVITYAGVTAMTTIENRLHDSEFEHELRLNSAVYIAGFAAGLLGRALYFVATKE